MWQSCIELLYGLSPSLAADDRGDLDSDGIDNVKQGAHLGAGN